MKVFLSHISEEAPIASVLKEWIESTFADRCEVFVSSDLSSLPAGSKWLDEIDNALKSSVAFLVLCSPSSLHRPWINFETGCGWIKRVPIIPICHSGQKKGDLPIPISMFQALEIEDKNFVRDLFGSIAKHLRIAKLPRIDKTEMIRDLNEAISSTMQNAQIQSVSFQQHTKKIELDDSALKIFKFIADHSTSSIVDLEFISSRIKLPTQKIQYYLSNWTKVL